MRIFYRNMAINAVSQNNLDLFNKKRGGAPATMNGTPPNVGVVDVPELSKTPLTDTLNKNETALGAKPVIKTEKKKLDTSFKLMVAAFLGCAVGLLGQVFKLFKK